MYFVCQVIYISVWSHDFLHTFYIHFYPKCIYKSYSIQLLAYCLDVDIKLYACQ